MGDLKHYVIRGGVEGRERLRVLARVMHASTSALFDGLDITDGMRCLDVGCGGGDVTLELARRVGPNGAVVGADLDDTKIELARREAAALGVGNVEFRPLDIREHWFVPEFDLVYARFLLTHLPNPVGTLAALNAALKPGGLLVVEDVDASGCFVFPESRAFRRFHELYCAAARGRGGDPDIGPRLPQMLKHTGFAHIGMNVVQPAGLEGDVKLIPALTMDNIGDAVEEMKLASRAEVARVTEELYDLAADSDTVIGLPRVVQTWGRKSVPAPSIKGLRNPLYRIEAPADVNGD